MGEKWLGKEVQKGFKKRRMTHQNQRNQTITFRAETVFITFCSYEWCLDLKPLPVLTACVGAWSEGDFSMSGGFGNRLSVHVLVLV